MRQQGPEKPKSIVGQDRWLSFEQPNCRDEVKGKPTVRQVPNTARVQVKIKPFTPHTSNKNIVHIHALFFLAKMAKNPKTLFRVLRSSYIHC